MVSTAACGAACSGSSPDSRPRYSAFAILYSMRKLINLIIFIAVCFGIYGVLKPLPDGINVAGIQYGVPSSSILFLQDVTYVDENSDRYSEQEIFDEVFRMIDDAHHYILLDMFLFNDFLGTATTSYRALSSELTDKLIAKKTDEPDIDIVFITDPINEIYGGYQSKQLKMLRDNGIEVVMTDLTKLRDSNPIVSSFWRAYFRWWGNSSEGGIFPNPFDARIHTLTLRTYLSLFNFKANHRKVILADRETSEGTKFSVLITSANPHDGSSAHTNTAIKVDDFLWKDVLASELAVASFSGVSVSKPDETFLGTVTDSKGSVTAQLLTEEEIRNAIIEHINHLDEKDTLDIAMFYLSDRKIIRALKQADTRGVAIRILLDPNKDAFGRAKNGIPNREVAHELLGSIGKNIKVRWCDTHGEQCHTKLLLLTDGDTTTLIEGSANLTRRNIGGYNLETDVLIEGNNSVPAIANARKYFNAVWNNEDGRIYSTDYDVYKDESFLKTLLYRAMEDVGTSSF